MAKRKTGRPSSFGAECRTVSLARRFNWPTRGVRGDWWRELAARVRDYPAGRQTSWGIPFRLGEGAERRVLLLAEGDEAVLPLTGLADYLCLLHEWRQLPDDVQPLDPTEGLVVGECVLAYRDGETRTLPIRARFEVAMTESPGPPWLAVGFSMPEAIDPARPPADIDWGRAQHGARFGGGAPLLCALPNPRPREPLKALILRALRPSPLIVAGLTLYCGAAHPLRHLPRRAYRVAVPGADATVQTAELDLGIVARLEETAGPCDRTWLASPYAGLEAAEPPRRPERLIHAVGAEDATLSVKLAGRRKPVTFSLGEAFHRGKAESDGGARLEVLGRRRQWMRVVVRDGADGRLAPTRFRLTGPHGEYIAPYGHHEQVNTGWFMDYGADVVVAGRNYAYVPGEFATDMPVGEVCVELNKGFEYRPVRRKVRIAPGQKVLELTVDRALDWRGRGWVTADTHVHFVSPQTAWLEGQCEGVNVVNLLASQWGRLFTNVGDLTGRVGVVEDDTIVYVGTENRNHMLGHMSMLGTQGLPVYPMCAGGLSEAYIGDPDFILLAEWARRNREQGGVVIRPHFPFCGFTEDPVPILQGLVDALEIRGLRGSDFPTQEWYRYLNCGYRVAVCGGTDKMSAGCAIGRLRTYARLDAARPFDYGHWAEAVRAGRTFATTGPLLDLTVDGKTMGDALRLPPGGGTLEVGAVAESAWPLGALEVVCNGRVAAAETAPAETRRLRLRTRVEVRGSGWIAARCAGPRGCAAEYQAAHTSPVYVQCGEARAFDGPAAEHMLALVEGGIAYLNALATVYDEASRRRMVGLFKQAQAELVERLEREGGRRPHHGRGEYHTHGHAAEADHHH